MANPMQVSITTTTVPTPTISLTIYILIGSIIVFILIVGHVLIIICYENIFDCGFECKFGEPLLLSPKIINGQSLTHTISFNFNRMERICALYEFGIVILLSLISNINVYFQVFDILYTFYFELIILTIVVVFLLCAQMIAFDSSARETFSNIFDNTVSIGCGILCTIAINNDINNYGYYQIINTHLNFVVTSLILKIFDIVLLKIYNSARGNINSGTFNTIVNDIKYFVYDTLLLVVLTIVRKILFRLYTIPYFQCIRRVCVSICNIIFDNGLSQGNSGAIDTISCTITCTCIDSHNEKQDGQVSMDFDNNGSNLALIGGILCTIFTILLLLSKVSRINDNDSIITILDTILKKMKRLTGVVLVVLISRFPFCAPAVQNRTSARGQPNIFANAPPTSVYDYTFDSHGYGSNIATIDCLSLKTFDLDTFDTIGTVFTCIFIQGLIILMINDILVCIIPNTIAYGYEKGIEKDVGAMDCRISIVAIFGW